MKRLFVWVRCPDGKIRFAGELATTEPAPGSGHFESEFEYARQWTGWAGAFALDPVSLPLELGSRRVRAELLYPPLAVFDDALPDDWGRRLLSASLKLQGRRPTLPEMLPCMRGGGTGALIFTEQLLPPEPDTTVGSVALPALLAAAEKFEAGTLPPTAEFRQLLQGSSRAGGGRPKGLIHDAAGEWIAKFPSGARDEGHDVVGLEAACLELAKRAGLEVPESRLQPVGRRRILLVRRFDVTEHGGRLHMVSMRTLCREHPGVYVQSYAQLAQVLRKYSAAPAQDIAMLFRYMAFNAAIGNVDDHLKNFWMLATPAGYRLAPAFDLVPDISGRSEHTLAFQHRFACPVHAELTAIGKAWAVHDMLEIIDQVVRAASAFAATVRRLRVRGGRRLDNLSADVRRRVRLIGGDDP